MFLLSCKGCPGFVEDDDGGDKNEDGDDDDGDEGYEYDDDVDESDEEDVVVSDPMRLLAIHRRSQNFSFQLNPTSRKLNLRSHTADKRRVMLKETNRSHVEARDTELRHWWRNRS